MDSGTHASTIHKPFVAHLQELQKRLMWTALFAVIFGCGAYFIHEQLLDLLRAPLGQTLYYTSPMGGFTFLFKLCAVAGLIFSLPVILYHIFEFLGPMLKKRQRSVIIMYTFWSFILACAGILFAYFVSLPSALHFLTQFSDKGIESLIGVDEYFNFALAYVGGLALLFQIPLLLLFINRITPLSPKKLFKTQRFVIVGSFIVAAMLTPTPDPFNQALMALPMIALYQISIVLIWFVNRKSTQPTAYEEDVLITDDIFRAIVADRPASAQTPVRQVLTPLNPTKVRTIDIKQASSPPLRPARISRAQFQTIRPRPIVTSYKSRRFEDISFVSTARN